MAASGWRGRFERLVRVLSVYVVIASARATPAAAADLPANYCALDRAPLLDWLRLAKGDDCPFDEDGNGLDDSVETALARCFVPEFAFDSRENALRPDEPHVVFNAEVVAPGVIRLHFAVLFARDGGYVLGTEFPCLRDEHNGDAESVTVDVVWLERDHRWFGAPLALHTLSPSGSDQRTALGDIAGDTSTGTHPRLYATAGKHHWLHRTDSLTYACNCGPLGRCGSVRDRADGAGFRVVPTSLRHAPGFVLREAAGLGPADAGAPRPRLLSSAPLDAAHRAFGNACSYRSSGSLIPATRSLGANDLGDLGYADESVFGPCFRGGLGGPCFATVSVGEALAWDNAPAKISRASEVGAGKLISTLLGIVGHPAAADAGKTKALGGAASRRYIAPGGVADWTQLLGSSPGATFFSTP